MDLPRSVPPRPSQPATRLRKALELRRAPFSSRVAPLQARVDARPPRLSRSRARVAGLPFPSSCLLVQPHSSIPPVAPRPSSPATTRRIPPAASRLSRSRDKAALLNANDNATVRSPLGPLGAKRSSHSLFSGWSKGARPWLSLIHNIKSFSTSSALMSGSTPDCCVTDSPSLLRRSAASAGVSASTSRDPAPEPRKPRAGRFGESWSSSHKPEPRTKHCE